MHQPLLGCVTLGHSLSLSESPLHVSRLPRVSSLGGKLLDVAPGRWQDLGRAGTGEQEEQGSGRRGHR